MQSAIDRNLTRSLEESTRQSRRTRNQTTIPVAASKTQPAPTCIVMFREMEMSKHTDIDPRLRGLIDILEDCRQFYIDAIPGSTGRMRWLHETKAQCYGAMLAEIHHWCARPYVLADSDATHPDPAMPRTAPLTGVAEPGVGRNDDFAVLLRRVNRLHEHLFVVTRTPLSGATDIAVAAEDVSVDVSPTGVSTAGRRRRRAGVQH